MHLSSAGYVPNLGVFQRRTGGRIALVTEANVYGRTLVTYILHLESKGNDALRLRQLVEVLVDCHRYGDPSTFLIGGDFNLNAGWLDRSDPLQWVLVP